MKLFEWEYRQDHHEDLNYSLKETGSILKDMVVKFNGLEFWNMFKKFGHTSVDFNQCDCWNKWKSRGVKQDRSNGLIVNFVEI